MSNFTTFQIFGQMTNIDRSWLACAIDAEGYLQITEKKNKENQKYPVIGIYNTNVDFIKTASILMQTKIVYHNNNPYGFKSKSDLPRKTMYLARCSGKKAQEILKEILPFLIIKKEKAIQLIKLNFMSQDEYFNLLKGKKYERCRRGHYFSGDNVFINSRGHQCCRLCIKLNQERNKIK